MRKIIMRYRNKTTGEIANLITGIKGSYLAGADVIPKRFIENSCDWEKIIKKDYEILSFINPDNKLLYTQHYNMWHTKTSDGCVQDTGSRTLNYCLDFYQIYSIIRLSDAEIFSVGDKVTERLSDKKNFNIKGFQNFQNKLSVLIVKGSTNTSACLNFLNKIANPLFTTEDGIEIFEGDTIYGINVDWKVFSHYSDLKNKVKSWGIKPFYSTEEKAQEYINLNKPQYTLKDMVKIANNWAYIKVTPEVALKAIEKW